MKSEKLINGLKASVDLIKKSRDIILACHLSPDGDAVGSMLGLAHGLTKLHKSITMLCADEIPERYITLPAARNIRRHYQATADLAISVDCAGINQLSGIEDVFNKSKRIIEIDHHVYRTRFGDVQLVDEHACSTGEIVYLLLEKLKVPFDKKIVECLLTSLLVETLSFSRQDVKTTTFETCTKLMRHGVDFRKVSDRYYWRRRLSAVRLSGLCLARIKMAARDQLAWSLIYKRDFTKFEGRQEDVDSVADDMMMVAGTKVAILFRETEDNILRVSLRSRDDIDIGYLATIYGGGGHHDVAGCRIHNNKRNIQKFIAQASSLIYKKTR